MQSINKAIDCSKNNIDKKIPKKIKTVKELNQLTSKFLLGEMLLSQIFITHPFRYYVFRKWRKD